MGRSTNKRSRHAVDWAVVKREYETGQLSIRKLAEMYRTTHTAINARVKKFGWKQHLADTVRKEIKSRLIVDPDGGQLPEQVEAARETQIDIAVKRGVEVVREHQTFLGKLRDISYLLADRLGRHLQNPKDFKADEEPYTFGGKPETPSDVLLKVSQSAAKWIPAERQAFNLDEEFGGESYEDVLKALLRSKETK